MWKRPFRTLAVIWTATTLVVSLMGPFGTFESMSHLDRTIYWGTIIALSIVLVGTIRQAVVALAKCPMHPFALDLIVLPVFTISYTPILYSLTREVHVGAPVFSFLETGLIVLAVSVVLIGMREAFGLHAPGVRKVSDDAETPALVRAEAPAKLQPSFDPRTQAEAPEPVAPSQIVAQAEAVAQWAAAQKRADTETNPLIERLPKECQGELLHISGRDHYVDIVTDAGNASILLRFSDALREVSGCAGMQVHRSHWVADVAVTGLRRDAHRLFVQLQSGVELPVSRPHAKEARNRWG